MKNKSYVQEQLERIINAAEMLQNDVDNNRPYTTQQYVMERLEFIKKSIILVAERIQLEDENS
jgi:ribosome biogenesis GTPase A